MSPGQGHGLSRSGSSHPEERNRDSVTASLIPYSYVNLSLVYSKTNDISNSFMHYSPKYQKQLVVALNNTNIIIYLYLSGILDIGYLGK